MQGRTSTTIQERQKPKKAQKNGNGPLKGRNKMTQMILPLISLASSGLVSLRRRASVPAIHTIVSSPLAACPGFALFSLYTSSSLRVFTSASTRECKFCIRVLLCGCPCRNISSEEAKATVSKDLRNMQKVFLNSPFNYSLSLSSSTCLLPEF